MSTQLENVNEESVVDAGQMNKERLIVITRAREYDCWPQQQYPGVCVLLRVAREYARSLVRALAANAAGRPVFIWPTVNEKIREETQASSIFQCKAL